MGTLHHIKNMPWCKQEWSYPILNEETRKLLKEYTDVIIHDDDDSSMKPEERIIEKSQAFPIPFPIQTVRVQELIKWRAVDNIRRNITSTYPLIHERVLMLMAEFLIYKKQFGTSIEMEFYKKMTVCGLIDRILKKRAVSFVGPYDKYKLLTGEEGASGWEEIGTSEEQSPLVLENYLSYDEMKLSAMVYISGYTECINNGTRNNGGVIKKDIAEPEAIIIGLIGPRFHRRGRMDYEDILITEDQNTAKNGYGENKSTWYDMLKSRDARDRQTRLHMYRQMWAGFYQIENNTYDQTSSIMAKEKDNSEEQKPFTKKYFQVKSLKLSHPIFDNEAYYRRISIIAESSLLEANYRAKENSPKTAFVNVIGCGLGVWMISGHQADVYVLSFLERMRALLETHSLDHVSDVNFAYIKTSPDLLELFPNEEQSTEFPGRRWFFMESEEHPKGGINLQMQNREPSSKLTGEHEGKLLVMTYPWDSNAHPGNEFWFGSLTTSGDPATACSTQVSELHNAHINATVSSNNVRVVGRHGLSTLAEYCLALTATE